MATILMSVAVGLIAVLLLSVGAGKWIWSHRIKSAAAALWKAPYSRKPLDLKGAEFRNLPLPVKRYFDFAWQDRRHIIKEASFRHAGEFRTGGANAVWSGFNARQVFVANPPGFVWDASIRMYPLAPVAVRDGYSRGAALMEARFAYLFPLVRQSGTPELAAGELHRFLAEAVWLPTTLLPGNGVSWTAIDDTSARASLTDAGISVSLDFFFGPDGEILRAFTPSRYRDADGKPVPTPWECRYGNYVKKGGFMIPLMGEVAWLLPEGRDAYYRADVKRIDFELEPI